MPYSGHTNADLKMKLAQEEQAHRRRRRTRLFLVVASSSLCSSSSCHNRRAAMPGKLHIVAHWQYGMSRWVTYDRELGENERAGYGCNSVEAAVVDFLEKHGNNYGIQITVGGLRKK